jgi:hypothetical protein
MNDNIYIALQNALKTSEPVRFYNTFRGMPVNFSGNVVKIVGNRISFKVSGLQIYNIILNRGTFIKIKELPGILYAQIADYNLQQETVDLWGFENRPNSIGFRSEVRVEPKKAMGALLTANKNVNLPISIFNLSLRGVRFMFDIHLFDPELFVIGRRMSMLFYIPAAGTAEKGMTIYYDIELRNAMVDRSKKYMSIGARAFPDKKSENYLVNFLAHRQKELLVELKALSSAKLA